jgi:hypothetical protein
MAILGKNNGEKRVVLGIKDRFHEFVNGDKTPEVRSDSKAFIGITGSNSVHEFLWWCTQHGAMFSEIYIIEDGKICIFEDYQIENTAGDRQRGE